jgi:surface polysaccharide O-acyltransferase-like enzyme
MSDQPAAAPDTRDEALDTTKGIAILAVVIFHMTRGFTDSGELPLSLALNLADAIAYGFHIQVFLIIAGYLAFPKAGSLEVQFSRQASLYYTYLLWSVISWTISSAMASLVNHPVSFSELLLIPIVPIQHFWFLLPLMLGTALMWILRTPTALVLGCLAVAVMISIPGIQLRIYGWVFYVLFGGLIRAAALRPKANLLVGLAGAALLFTAAWRDVAHNGQWFHSPPFTNLVSLSGCYAAYVVGSYAVRSRLIGSALAFLGRHSMPIFLLHAITGSGLRIVLAHVAPGLDVYIAILLTILLGIYLPIAIEWAAEQIGLATLFGFKPFRFGQRRRAAAA